MNEGSSSGFPPVQIENSAKYAGYASGDHTQVDCSFWPPSPLHQAAPQSRFPHLPQPDHSSAVSPLRRIYLGMSHPRTPLSQPSFPWGTLLRFSLCCYISKKNVARIPSDWKRGTNGSPSKLSNAGVMAIYCPLGRS